VKGGPASSLTPVRRRRLENERNAACRGLSSLYGVSSAQPMFHTFRSGHGIT
jgi:hypothetical protein